MENNKVLGWLTAGLLAALLLVSGLSLSKQGDLAAQLAAKSFGSEINYSTSGSQQKLYDNFNSLATDVSRIRGNLSGILSATSSISWGSISSTTATTSYVTVTGALPGDFVLVSASSTANATGTGFRFTGFVSDTNTVNVSVVLTTSTSGNLNIGTAVTAVRVLPAASFAAPSALITSTSTSN